MGLLEAQLPVSLDAPMNAPFHDICTYCSDKCKSHTTDVGNRHKQVLTRPQLQASQTTRKCTELTSTVLLGKAPLRIATCKKDKLLLPSPSHSLAGPGLRWPALSICNKFHGARENLSECNGKNVLRRQPSIAAERLPEVCGFHKFVDSTVQSPSV